MLKCGSTTRARALSTAYRSNRQWASNAGDGITRLDLRAYRSNRQWASNAGDGITRLDLRAYRSNRQWASNAGDGITRLDLRAYRSNRQWASNAGGRYYKTRSQGIQIQQAVGIQRWGRYYKTRSQGICYKYRYTLYIPAYLTCSTLKGLFSQSENCSDLSSGLLSSLCTSKLSPLQLPRVSRDPSRVRGSLKFTSWGSRGPVDLDFFWESWEVEDLARGLWGTE